MKTGEEQFLRVKEWENYRRIVHGFGTKGEAGGKISKKDWWGNSLTERGESFPLVATRQVHGDGVIVFTGDGQQLEDLWLREGDALVSRLPGFALGVFTADCLPILLFDPFQEAVGIVHAGWKGTARAVSRKAVEKMREAFHCREENILVAMGPGIGPCCLEVDGPVQAVFAANGLPWEHVAFPRGGDKWSLNLQRANTRLLEEAGVKQENIHRVDFCTSCRPDTFFSYRGGGETQGRQLSFIALRKSD